MKTLNELKSVLSSHKEELKQKYKIKGIGIFGSYANGMADEKSDVDILVDFSEPIGLDFVTLADELEDLLGVKVDLVSLNAIKPRLMPYVKESLVYV